MNDNKMNKISQPDKLQLPSCHTPRNIILDINCGSIMSKVINNAYHFHRTHQNKDAHVLPSHCGQEGVAQFLLHFQGHLPHRCRRFLSKNDITLHHYAKQDTLGHLLNNNILRQVVKCDRSF